MTLWQRLKAFFAPDDGGILIGEDARKLDELEKKSWKEYYDNL